MGYGLLRTGLLMFVVYTYGAEPRYKQLNDTYIDGTTPVATAQRLSSPYAVSSLWAESGLLVVDRAQDTCSLNVTEGKCCPGDSFLSVQNVSDTPTCCQLCHAHAACSAFTLNKAESTCWLKDMATSSYSGDCDCGHPGPVTRAHAAPQHRV